MTRPCREGQAQSPTEWLPLNLSQRPPGLPGASHSHSPASHHPCPAPRLPLRLLLAAPVPAAAAQLTSSVHQNLVLQPLLLALAPQARALRLLHGPQAPAWRPPSAADSAACGCAVWGPAAPLRPQQAPAPGDPPLCLAALLLVRLAHWLLLQLLLLVSRLWPLQLALLLALMTVPA